MINLLKTLSILFKTNQKIIIFDIGACEGEDSIKYRKQFPKSVIHLFEPLPKNFNKLRLNIEKLKLDNFFINELALTNINGEGSFFVSSGKPNKKFIGDWNKSSSLLEPNEVIMKEKYNWLEYKSIINVKLMTLNEYCKIKKIKKIDFIHMDVQGAEYLVLEGANLILPSVKIIWLEVENEEYYRNQKLGSEIHSFLKSLNFKLILDTSKNKSEGDSLYVNMNLINKYDYFNLKLYSIVKTNFNKFFSSISIPKMFLFAMWRRFNY